MLTFEEFDKLDGEIKQSVWEEYSNRDTRVGTWRGQSWNSIKEDEMDYINKTTTKELYKEMLEGQEHATLRNIAERIPKKVLLTYARKEEKEELEQIKELRLIEAI